MNINFGCQLSFIENDYFVPELDEDYPNLMACPDIASNYEKWLDGKHTYMQEIDLQFEKNEN